VDISVAEIAQIINADVIGDGSVRVGNVRGIEYAEPGDLTFCIDPKYVPDLKKTKASAVLVRADLKDDDLPITQIVVEDPRAAFQTLTEALAPPPIEYPPGVHPTAYVADDAILGDNVSVQPFAVVESGCTIGANVVIGAQSYVGHYSTVGRDSLIYQQVVVRERTAIGERVILHPGVVIGGDGFGYDQVDGKHVKIPQIGTVVIEDDVEIGANTTVDRARFDKTIIKRGSKIDNLVMIAHNCEIGEDCILCGQVGLSGSAKLGQRVVMAGQTGMAGHVKLGDDVIIGAKSGVSKSLLKEGFYIGLPAVPHMTYKKREAATLRMPNRVTFIEREIDKLKQELAALKKQSD
jgi:UDP-3-O-[3-hydroxymyristoyl] glucosamine N-acyltransferase